MKCSTITGSLNGELKVFKKVDDETLMLTTIVIRGRNFPLVGYSNIFEKVSDGKVNAVCTIKSDTREGKLFTYLHAFNIEKCFEDRMDTSEIEVEGVLHRKNRFTVDKARCQEVQSFLMRYRDGDGKPCTVHAVAKGKLARSLSTVAEGTGMAVKGILRTSHNILELKVNEIDILGGEAYESCTSVSGGN